MATKTGQKAYHKSRKPETITTEVASAAAKEIVQKMTPFSKCVQSDRADADNVDEMLREIMDSSPLLTRQLKEGSRRLAVSERAAVERQYVYKTVKNFIRIKNIDKIKIFEMY